MYSYMAVFSENYTFILTNSYFFTESSNLAASLTAPTQFSFLHIH